MLLPDPAIVRIAGIEFAVTGSEIIQHLGREEIGCSDNCEDQDRVSRLVRDLFRYPCLVQFVRRIIVLHYIAFKLNVYYFLQSCRNFS